jgi:hypothetical protein
VRRFSGAGNYQLTVTTFESRATETPTPTATPTIKPTPTPGPCSGDCGADGFVTIDELVIGLDIALGNLPLAACPAADVDRSGTVSIDDLIRTVPAVLFGCVESAPKAFSAPPAGRGR